ncbi:MAG TPA: serine protease [Sediminibacterium sp.]
MKILPKFLNSLVPIGISTPLDSSIFWIGTGFLVIDREKEEQLFVVTNKHVIASQKDVIIRFNSVAGVIFDFPVNLNDGTKDHWTGHPNAEIDVSIIPIPADIIAKNKLQAEPIELGSECATKQFLIDKGIGEGEDIYVVGYPMSQVDSSNSFPIVRKGIISKIRHCTIQNNKDFTIDALVFPGNSGGPVFLEQLEVNFEEKEITRKKFLIGVVKSYIPYRDHALSAQTQQLRVVFEENSGLAHVELADRVIETVKIYKTK